MKLWIIIFCLVLAMQSAKAQDAAQADIAQADIENCLSAAPDAVAVQYGGKTYRVKDEACRALFQTDPERYAQLFDALLEKNSGAPPKNIAQKPIRNLPRLRWCLRDRADPVRAPPSGGRQRIQIGLGRFRSVTLASKLSAPHIAPF